MNSDIIKIIKFLTENIVLSNFLFGSCDIDSITNLNLGKFRIEENRVQYLNFYLESGVFINELNIFQSGSIRDIGVTIYLENHQNYTFHPSQSLLPKEYIFISSKHSIDSVIFQEYKYIDSLKEYNIDISLLKSKYVSLSLYPEYQSIIQPITIVSKIHIEDLAGEIVKTGTLAFESASSIDELYEMKKQRYYYLNKEYFVNKFNTLVLREVEKSEFVKEKILWSKDNYVFKPFLDKEISYTLEGEPYEIWRSQNKSDCQNVIISGTLVTYSNNTYGIIVEHIKNEK